MHSHLVRRAKDVSIAHRVAVLWRVRRLSVTLLEQLEVLRWELKAHCRRWHWLELWVGFLAPEMEVLRRRWHRLRELAKPLGVELVHVEVEGKVVDERLAEEEDMEVEFRRDSQLEQIVGRY